MGSKHSIRRRFSEDFILTLLREYYSSDVSINFICRKYDIGSASFYQWQKKYDLDEKKLSLSHDVIIIRKSKRCKKFKRCVRRSKTRSTNGVPPLKKIGSVSKWTHPLFTPPFTLSTT